MTASALPHEDPTFRVENKDANTDALMRETCPALDLATFWNATGYGSIDTKVRVGVARLGLVNVAVHGDWSDTVK